MSKQLKGLVSRFGSSSPMTTDRESWSSPRLIWSIVALGVLLRLVLTVTSIGSNDVVFWLLWERLVEAHGVTGAYALRPDLNHPPLALLVLDLLGKLSDLTAIEVTDLLRVGQAAADLVTFGALMAITRILYPSQPASLAATLYYLAPFTIFVSGFHANTDPTMLAFLTLSILLVLSGRPFAGGFIVGIATGIKIVPLIAAPFLLFANRDRGKVSFAAGLLSSLSLVFGPLLILRGIDPLRQIFGYGGFAGKWGFISVLLRMNELLSGGAGDTELYRIALRYDEYGRFVTIAALSVLFIWYMVLQRRRPESRGRLLVQFVGLAYLVVLVLAAGFGIQYLLWPLPFIWFLLGTRTTIYTVSILSAYGFLTYTIWSGGFPWWYADSIAASPAKHWITLAALGVWVFLGVITMVGILSVRARAVGTAE